MVFSIHNILYILFHLLNIVAISIIGLLFGGILSGIIIINMLKLHHIDYDPSFHLFINLINLLSMLALMFYFERLYIFYVLKKLKHYHSNNLSFFWKCSFLK